MTLTLTLPPDLEERLYHEAKRRELPTATLVVQLLDRYLPSKDPRRELIALLQSWIDDGDDQEQKETGDYLVQALDEDRPSDRRLFPPGLKDVTW